MRISQRGKRWSIWLIFTIVVCAFIALLSRGNGCSGEAGLACAAIIIQFFAVIFLWAFILLLVDIFGKSNGETCGRHEKTRKLIVIAVLVIFVLFWVYVFTTPFTHLPFPYL